MRIEENIIYLSDDEIFMLDDVGVKGLEAYVMMLIGAQTMKEAMAKVGGQKHE